MKILSLFSISIVLMNLSCQNNSEDDLTDAKPIGNTKYIENVKPIIDSKCNNCHGATLQFGAPMPLVTYTDVKNAVLNRNLIGDISRTEADPDLMPLGGPRLPQNSIDIIIDWQNDGFLE